MSLKNILIKSSSSVLWLSLILILGGSIFFNFKARAQEYIEPSLTTSDYFDLYFEKAYEFPAYNGVASNFDEQKTDFYNALDVFNADLNTAGSFATLYYRMETLDRRLIALTDLVANLQNICVR